MTVGAHEAPAAAASIGVPKRAAIHYFANRRGSLGQRIHAGLILVLPALGLAYAVIEIARGSVALWQPLVALGLYVATMLGITVGFHRMLAHRAFDASPAVRRALVILGSMAVQGPPIYWVSNHRRHHRFSDDAGDPHSPHDDDGRSISGWQGFWHAHIGWTFNHALTNSALYCRTLLQDRDLAALNRRYFLWVTLGLLLPAAIGGAITRTAAGAFEGALWGGLVRLFFAYHVTNSINSVTHLFGSRPFATTDRSRNTLWLAAAALGEGWHNNHHAFPVAAIFAFERGQIDIGGLCVRLLEKLGLATSVRRANPDVLARLRDGIAVGSGADDDYDQQGGAL